MANIFKSLFGRETETPNTTTIPEKDYDKAYEEIGDNDHLTDIVKLPNGEYVMVDSQFVEGGVIGYYETMVFHCDEDGNRNTKHPDFIVGKSYNIATDFDTVKENHTKICDSFESEGHYHGISKSASYAADIGREDYVNTSFDLRDIPKISGMDMSLISLSDKIDSVKIEDCTNIDISKLGNVDTVYLKRVDMQEVKLEGFEGRLIIDHCYNLEGFEVDGSVSELEVYDCNVDGLNIDNFDGELKIGECDQNQAWLSLYVYKEWHDNGYQEDKVTNDVDNDMDNVDNDMDANEPFIEEPQSTRDNDLDWNDVNREDILKDDDLDYNDIISVTEENIDNNIDSIISEAIEDSGLQDDIDNDIDNDKPDNIANDDKELDNTTNDKDKPDNNDVETDSNDIEKDYYDDDSDSVDGE